MLLNSTTALLPEDIIYYAGIKYGASTTGVCPDKHILVYTDFIKRGSVIYTDNIDLGQILEPYLENKGDNLYTSIDLIKIL